MAIALDTTNKAAGSANNATVSLTAAVPGELAIIWINYDPADTFSSLTVGGSSTGITQIGSEFAVTGGRKVRCYYLQNPPNSATNYSFTTTGADQTPQIYVEILSGCSTTAPADSNATKETATSGITLTTTVVASNCWLLSYYQATGSGTNNNAAGSGTVLRQTLSSISIGDSNGTVGTGSQSMAWTGGRTNSAGFIISIAPPGAAVASRQNNFLLMGV